MKHTFGRRLRSAGVSFEDRQDLLGHRSGRITTHYSAAELSRLLKAANRLCKNKEENKQPEIGDSIAHNGLPSRISASSETNNSDDNGNSAHNTDAPVAESVELI